MLPFPASLSYVFALLLHCSVCCFQTWIHGGALNPSCRQEHRAMNCRLDANNLFEVSCGRRSMELDLRSWIGRSSNIWGYQNVAGRYYCKFLVESWVKGVKSRRRWQGGRWSFCYCSRILSIEGKLDLREELKKKQQEKSWPEGRKRGRKDRVFKFSGIDAIAVVIAIEGIVDARVKLECWTKASGSDWVKKSERYRLETDLIK